MYDLWGLFGVVQQDPIIFRNDSDMALIPGLRTATGRRCQL